MSESESHERLPGAWERVEDVIVACGGAGAFLWAMRLATGEEWETDGKRVWRKGEA